MPKKRKKLTSHNWYRYKDNLLSQTEEINLEYDQIAKSNGWVSGEARTIAMKINYIKYNKNENLEYEGD